MKVVVIDDEPDVCATLAAWIHSEGHLVEAFQHPFDALDAIASMKPDVIILDHRMPEARGLDLVETIRTLAPTSRVIVLTGYSNYDLVHQAVAKGAESVLSKPIDRRVLLNVIGVMDEHP